MPTVGFTNISLKTALEHTAVSCQSTGLELETCWHSGPFSGRSPAVLGLQKNIGKNLKALGEWKRKKKKKKENFSDRSVQPELLASSPLVSND